MCSNVNSREEKKNKEEGESKKRRDCAYGEPKFNRKAQAESREKFRCKRRREGKRKKREKRRIHEVARAWGRERERMRKSLKLNIV